MNKPLFSIGETVIRQAINYPEGNGEYVVCGIIGAKEAQSLYLANWGTDGFYYELGGFSVTLDNGCVSNHSYEPFLKKKHKPSDQSFDQIMSSLKQPQKA